MGNEIPLGESPRVLAILQENEAAKTANREPLPGALATAFAVNTSIEIEGNTGKISVRPLVKNDWAILKELNSPLYRQIMEFEEAAKKSVEAGNGFDIKDAKAIDGSNEECLEACYLFTRPLKEARQVYLHGRKLFTEKSLELGDEWDTTTTLKVQTAILQQMMHSWLTTLSYVVGNDTETEKKSPAA